MPAKQPPPQFQFDLSGGHLALDFANTVSRRDTLAKQKDHLNSYRDLVAFAQQCSLITAPEAQALQRASEIGTGRAAQVFRAAIALREAMYRSFARAATGKPALPQDIVSLEKMNATGLRHRRITRFHNRYVWQWEQGSELQRLLWPIAHSAAELMVSPQLAKVRECKASDCAWLFLDTSRNQSRRWCDMKACGNREKARRHYQRQHPG